MASCGTTSNNNEITEEETGQLNTHERERPLIPPPPLPPLPRTTLMASLGTTSNNNEITEEEFEGDQAQCQQQFQQGKTFLTPIQYSTQPQRQSTAPYFDEYNTTQPYFPYPPQGDQNQFQQGRFEGDQAQYQHQFQQGQAFSIPIQYSTQSQRTDPYFDGHINTQPYFGYSPQGTDYVRVLVAYNGKWRWDGEKWLFENSKGSIIVVSKYVTLSEISDMLYEEFQVDQDSYDLKLEVHYIAGSPWFPIIEIKDDEDLSVFISESWKTKLPLCVTRVTKVVVVEGAEHGLKDNKAEKRLINAMIEGDWVKAREIINAEKLTLTSKLDDDGFTALHFAVGLYRDNEVVKEILLGINSDELLTIVDNNMLHPAHHAAGFGNTEALKIMLDSNPKCLFLPDNYDHLPIHYTLATPAMKTFLCLFKQMKSNKVEYDFVFGGIYGHKLLHQIIDTGLIDVAYEFINDHPSLATTVYEDKTALECIIRKPELFYSGTSYNFYSRFVYHVVPIENNNFGSTDTADEENQETPKKDKFVTKHMKRCLHNGIAIYELCDSETVIKLNHIYYE